MGDYSTAVLMLYTQFEADKRDISFNAAVKWNKRKDPTYLAALSGKELQLWVRDQFDDLYAGEFAQLGALMGTVANSSLLVTQEYSIGIQRDDIGRIIGVHDEDGLNRMLGLAEQTAEQAVGEAAIATNGESTPALVVALDAARRNKDQPVSVQDKFTALSMYWMATMNARMMTRLARSE